MEKLEEIRKLIGTGKGIDAFNAAGILEWVIPKTSTADVVKVAPEIKRWFTEDLSYVYLPPSNHYIPGSTVNPTPAHFVNESLWLLERDGVADKLREAGILEEIVESLLKKAESDEFMRLKKFLTRSFSNKEIVKQLFNRAGSYKYDFGLEETEALKQLEPQAQKEILKIAVQRAVKLNLYEAIAFLVRALKRNDVKADVLRDEIVEHVLNKYFP